jgi:hypothetical protein
LLSSDLPRDVDKNNEDDDWIQLDSCCGHWHDALLRLEQWELSWKMRCPSDHQLEVSSVWSFAVLLHCFGSSCGFPLPHLHRDKETSKETLGCNSSDHSFRLQTAKRDQIMATSNETLKNKSELKIAITLSLIVGTYLALWLPVMVFFLVMAVTELKKVPLHIYMIFTRLISLSAAIEPFIYVYRTRNIREALKRLGGAERRKSVSVESRKSSLYFIGSTMPKVS